MPAKGLSTEVKDSCTKVEGTTGKMPVNFL